ncbi:hypothetical protein HCB29_08255 [Listeria booriae]|nr:hypothetical protein [Listeria booriae]
MGEQTMKNSLASIFDGSRNEILTDDLVIKDNLIKFKDSSIQLSNISYLIAGMNKFRIPMMLILTIIIALIVVRFIPFLGVILLGIAALYIWYLYNEYQKSRLYLTFFLNSGQAYHVFFVEESFLNDARQVIETSMINRHQSYSINIKEQKIIEGDNHEFKGDNIHVNSHNSTVDSSVKMGDIKNSSMQGVAFGTDNTVNVRSDEHGYDWDAIKAELASVIASIKIETPLKEASIEALDAAEKQDAHHFEAVVKRNKLAFVSDLFQNTASQFLAQVITKTLGI